MSRGGTRQGAGRPKGTTKDESQARKQRQLRAHDDEWELITVFAKEVRKGDKLACIQFITELKKKEDGNKMENKRPVESILGEIYAIAEFYLEEKKRNQKKVLPSINVFSINPGKYFPDLVRNLNYGVHSKTIDRLISEKMDGIEYPPGIPQQLSLPEQSGLLTAYWAQKGKLNNWVGEDKPEE